MSKQVERFLTDAEEKAVKRVETAIKALPKSIALYFHGDSASVLACDEDGRMLREGTGLSREANLGGIQTPRCQAGDW